VKDVQAADLPWPGRRAESEAIPLFRNGLVCGSMPGLRMALRLRNAAPRISFHAFASLEDGHEA